LPASSRPYVNREQSRDDVAFSVVVPLYNHSNYIEATLQSVLDQTHEPREIIVIDDGSQDGSYAKARDFLARHRIGTVLTQSNSGAHATINAAIERSTSPYIAVLNSDDRFLPTKLARCAELLIDQPNLDLIFGRVVLIDQYDATIRDGVSANWMRRSLEFLDQVGDLGLAVFHENFAATTSNFVFSRRQWQCNGGFKALRYCHDLDFLLETNGSGAIYFDSKEDHIAYRIHPANTIKENLAGVMVERLTVLANALHGKVFRDRKHTISTKPFELFKQSLDDKGGPHLIAYLAAQRSLFDNRDDFYAWAIDNAPNNRALRTMFGGEAKPNQPSRAVDKPNLTVKAATPAGTPDRRTQVGVREVATRGRGRAVAIELSTFDQGGLEKVVLDTSLLLMQRGLEPIIISQGKVGLLGDRATAAGLRVYQLPGTDPVGFYRRLIDLHSIKLGVSHFSRVGYPIFRDMHVPNVTFIHNVYAFLNGTALENFRSDDRYVDQYISVSPKATAYSVERLGIDPARILTVPNGLIIDEHLKKSEKPSTVTRAEFGLKETDYVFLNVASYNLHKGHYLMAAAMRLLLTRRQDIKILCIGNIVHRPHIDSLKAYLAENGLAEHILLPGYFENVADFHRMSDAFLMPSLIEGWSIAMNEAMFYERPLLMTDTGGASEVIEDGDIGKLLPNEYGDIRNLDSTMLDELGYNRRFFRTAPFMAQAMTEFADRREHWRLAGRKGREKILQRYDFCDVVDEYVGIFADVMDRR
jgi:glycosyltransferase involved in cell wall biosynthesis